MSAPERPAVVILRIRPGETREQFNARVIAAAGPLSDAAMARVRQLLPPVRRRKKGRVMAASWTCVHCGQPVTGLPCPNPDCPSRAPRRCT